MNAVVATITLASSLFVSVPGAAAVCGDLNSTSDLSASDALVCLQGAVGTISLDGRCEPADNCGPVFPACGDVNDDDRNTAGDCLLVLQAAVGSADITSSCDCKGGQLCGNGDVDAGTGETCDDGNVSGGDECPADCGRGPCADVEPVAGTAIAAELVAAGFNNPVYVTAAPGDTSRLYVVEQDGLVRVVENGEIRSEPFLDIHERVKFEGCCGEETGLLSIAFHPDYARNGWVFVAYSSLGLDKVIARFEKLDDADALDPNSEKQLFTVPQDNAYHNGGQLQFAADGTLWIGNGDGNGGGGDQAGHAQRDGDLLGKLLRVDVDVEDAPYWAVPADNPDPGDTLASLIWAKGLRNPWRFSFDRETGDMIIADVGQDEVEEIDLLPADSTGGENFGWNIFEGSQCFDGGCGPSELIEPISEYEHDGTGASITGGYVYRGCALPDLHGTYFFSDYVLGFVRTLRISGGQASNEKDVTAALEPPGDAEIDHPSSFGEDVRGEIYIVDYTDGELFKIVPK